MRDSTWWVAALTLAAACGASDRAIVDAAVVDATLDGRAGDDAAPVDAGGLGDAPALDGAPTDAGGLGDAPALDGAPVDAAIAIDAAAPVDAAVAIDAAACPVGIDEQVAATITVTTDDNTRLWLNGVLLDATPRVWSDPQRYDVMIYAHPGHPNVIALEGINLQNQAGYDRGIVADVRFTAGGAAQTVITDASWRATNTLTTGWELPGFDDSAWPAAVPLGAVGIAPWGAVLATLAPGSTAQWIWTYDPAAATSKPTVESTYARRTFAAVDARCVVVNAR